MGTAAQNKTAQRQGQAGNIFTVLLAAVALLGLLSFATYNLLSGPVAGMVNLSRKTMVDSQMLAISRILIAEAIEATSGGDCDGDGAVEPAAYVDPGVAPSPTGGGHIPSTLGVSETDAWGQKWGYCVWDVGTSSDAAGCGGPGALRLDGDNDPLTGTDTGYVLALVSAGPDSQFQTSCINYADESTAVITAGGDDIVHKFTYQEAAGIGGGLWNLKTSDSDVAEITKNLNVKAIGGGTSATIGFDSGLGLEAVGDFLSIKTDNLYERTASNDIALQNNIHLVQDAGVADRAVKGIFKVVPKSTPDALIASGTGTRLTFYPDLAALRAGGITDADGAGVSDTDTTEWDVANMGTHSTAFGRNSKASGNFSFAAGADVGCFIGLCNGGWATGTAAAAFGVHTVASGQASFATGLATTAGPGQASFASGAFNGAAGDYSMAVGYFSVANGVGSILFSLDGAAHNLAQDATFSVFGSVGIGTVTPVTPLEVAGTMKIGNTGETCQDGLEGMARYNAADDVIEYCADNGGSGAEVWKPIGGGGAGDGDWEANGTTLYRETGNVGIGVSSPGALLDIAGRHELSGDGSNGGAYHLLNTNDNTVVKLEVNADSNGRLAVAGDSGAVVSEVVIAEPVTTANDGEIRIRKFNAGAGVDAVTFGTGSSAEGLVAVNDGSGNTVVRIGLAPSADLEGGVEIYNANGNSVFRAEADESTRDGRILVFEDGGTQQFQFGSGIHNFIGDDTYAHQFCVHQTTCNAELDVIGDIEYTGTATPVSDRRVKDNISALGKDVVEKLRRLRPVSYVLKQDPHQYTRFGFIAQEVEGVFPELVFADETSPEKYKTLHYEGLVAPLTQAIQNVMKEADSLARAINSVPNYNPADSETLLKSSSDLKNRADHILRTGGQRLSASGRSRPLFYSLAGGVSLAVMAVMCGFMLTRRRREAGR